MQMVWPLASDSLSQRRVALPARRLEAPRLLLAPLQLLIFGGANVLTPHASVVYQRDHMKQGLRSLFSKSAVLWVGCCVAYIVALTICPGFWMRLAYGDKFEGGAALLLCGLLFTFSWVREAFWPYSSQP